MKRYNYYVLSIVLAIALIGAGIWGYTQYELMTSFRNGLNYQYQRYFYDMKDNIETVQSSLSKVLLSESKEQNILLLSQIYQQSYSAKDKLSQLPIRHSGTSKVEKFLNQIGDYSYSLIQDLLQGKTVDPKQMQALFLLQDYSGMLSTELQSTFNKVMKGDIDFKLVNKVESKELDEIDDKMIDTGFTKFEEKQLTQYPELIYDGPFSDQILDVKPRGLGDKKVTEEEAKKIALEFFDIKSGGKITRFNSGDDVQDTNEANKNKKGPSIDSYTFSIEANDGKEGGVLYIAVSKLGGHIVWAERPRAIPNTKISKDEAVKIAQKKMKEKDIENMEPNYSESYNNMILINFAYTQDEVTVYTDLIKVKVALDNGQIVGYDAAHYLKTHIKREIPKPNISAEEARDKVKYDFDVEKVRLVLIPDRGLKEILCYEFKGNYKGWDYIVYINALNGREERILRIIKGKNGILMM